MEDKKQIKISLSTCLLIIAIIAIVIMIFFIYYILNEKNTLNEKVNSLENKLSNINMENKSESVSKDKNVTTQNTTDVSEIPYNTTAKFSYEDLKVDNIKYGMTEKQVIDIMGQPDEKNDATDEQDVYGESISYIYGDLGLTFYKHDDKMLLSSAYTESSNYTFTKGLKVGDTKEKVINSFYKENEDENKLRDIATSMPPNPGASFGKYLYGHAVGDDVTDAIKEKGNVEYAFINYYGYDSKDSKSNYMIEYNYAEPPYDSDYADSQDVNGILVFDMNTNNIVTGIRWYFYPRNND